MRHLGGGIRVHRSIALACYDPNYFHHKANAWNWAALDAIVAYQYPIAEAATVRKSRKEGPYGPKKVRRRRGGKPVRAPQGVPGPIVASPRHASTTR